MPAPEQIISLVQRFDLHAESYRTGSYNETQLRREFIDPFFKALGWDMDNEQGYAEAYKDVIHEDAIRIGDATKAPDYCFRIGGNRRFFVEAKKPAVDIRGALSPAYQLRRYAWSAQLPLSILTDFEDLAVYDCRVKPSQNDKASTARVLLLSYSDYISKWDEVASLFSKSAVLTGAFDRYAQSAARKKGTAAVDDSFLEEIETWRKTLAQNLALRNRKLRVRALNYAVQQIIDRIIFLRICEDRGIEPYGRLLKLVEGEGTYSRLVDLFELADRRFNSGLFHFEEERGQLSSPDTITPRLQLDDRVLKNMIRRLYYPECPFAFSVFSADILGQVYERFLGKVIRLTSGHQAKIEDKPEVRRAGGVFYTPSNIVDHIVRRTISPLIEGNRIQNVPSLTILDPACGSGSFLIGAYQFLLDQYRDDFVASSPEKHSKGKHPRLYRGSRGEWRLTTAAKKQILLNHIYGVDIDPQAVEVTRLSLLLKLLEGETDELLRLLPERVLPDLASNIKQGNSLISRESTNKPQIDLFDSERTDGDWPFNWDREFPAIMDAGGFDVVLGNPPYDVLEKARGAASWPHEALADYVRTSPNYGPALGGKLNLFRFFVIRALELLRVGGDYGMILPLALLGDISCANTRRHLMFSTQALVADCFPQKDNRQRRVFRDAKLSTVVMTGRRAKSVAPARASLVVKVYPGNDLKDLAREAIVSFEDIKLLDPVNTPVPLLDEKSWSLCKRLHRQTGVQRLQDVKAFAVGRGEINQTIYRKFITENPRNARLLKGVEVGRYCVHSHLSQGRREWFDEAAFHRAGHSRRDLVARARIATQRITGIDERWRLVASLVDPPCYFADSTNSIGLTEGSGYRLEYLLGLLNSRLFQWRFKLTSTNNNVGTNELGSLPFRTINFGISEERTLHDRMVRLVQTMLQLHESLERVDLVDELTRTKRRLAAIDEDEIEPLVASLYGLKAEDSAILREGPANMAAATDRLE